MQTQMKLVIGIASVYVLTQVVGLFQQQQSIDVQNETYLTNLQSSYQRDLAECIQLLRSGAGEEVANEVAAGFTELCREQVSDRRNAQLLMQKGRVDLINEVNQVLDDALASQQPQQVQGPVAPDSE